jgi:hypothetical protein
MLEEKIVELKQKAKLKGKKINISSRVIKVKELERRVAKKEMTEEEREEGFDLTMQKGYRKLEDNLMRYGILEEEKMTLKENFRKQADELQKEIEVLEDDCTISIQKQTQMKTTKMHLEDTLQSLQIKFSALHKLEQKCNIQVTPPKPHQSNPYLDRFTSKIKKRKRRHKTRSNGASPKRQRQFRKHNERHSNPITHPLNPPLVSSQNPKSIPGLSKPPGFYNHKN